MRKYYIATIAIVLIMMTGATARAQDRMVLEPASRDFSMPAAFELIVPGMQAALEWENPPYLGRIAGKKDGIAFMPYEAIEKPRYMNELKMISTAQLIQKVLSDGSTASIEADMIGDEFTALIAPRTALELGYYQFEVRTEGSTVSDTSVFNLASAGLKQRFRISKRPIVSGVLEVKYFDNNLYDLNYISSYAAAPMGDRITASLGFAYLDSDMGSEMDIVSGVRVELGRKAHVYALYNGVDPFKHIYNNHLLQMPSGLGPVPCANCEQKNVSAGLSYMLGKNIAFNLLSYDITDLNVLGGSVYYVVKD